MNEPEEKREPGWYRLSVHLQRRDVEELRRIADRDGATLAGLVRVAIREHLRERARERSR